MSSTRELLHERYWRMYSDDTPTDEAIKLFVARYGRPPERVVQLPGVILLGPVPEAVMEGGE